MKTSRDEFTNDNDTFDGIFGSNNNFGFGGFDADSNDDAFSHFADLDDRPHKSRRLNEDNSTAQIINSLESRIDTLNQQNDAKDQEIAFLKQQFALAQELLNNQTQLLPQVIEGKTAPLKEEINKLTEQITELTKQIAQLTGENEGLKVRSNVFELTFYQNQILAKNNRIAQLEQMLKAREDYDLLYLTSMQLQQYPQAPTLFSNFGTYLQAPGTPMPGLFYTPNTVATPNTPSAQLRLSSQVSSSTIPQNNSTPATPGMG